MSSADAPRLRLREEHLNWREVEGEVLALDLRESRYLAVNQTGRKLWSALARGATRAELVGELVSAYGVESERAAADVDGFVAELEGRDLIIRELA